MPQLPTACMTPQNPMCYYFKVINSAVNMSSVQLLVLLSCSLQHTCLIHKGSFCIACSRILLGYYGVLLLFFDLVLL